MFTATIEQHRRDYSGVYKRPPAKAEFNTVEMAQEWVTAWFDANGTAMRFAVIEGDGYYASTGTDPAPDEWEVFTDTRQEQKAATAR